MFRLTKPFLPLTLLLATAAMLRADQPVIQSLNANGALTWTNPVSGNLSVIERTTDLSTGLWTPFFYDWGTNGLYSTPLPPGSGAQTFYRIGVRTNVPDTNLVMHLSFDNDFPQGTVLDVSGNGNHGLRYGRPLYPTNWPTPIKGIDGSRAAEFRNYFDGYGLYGRSGDYIAIPYSPQFTNMTRATIAVWAYYYTAFGSNILNDHTSTILNSGKDFAGTWSFGREYASSTSFIVNLSAQNAVEPIMFPDASPTGNSGGWNHYVITFDQGVVKGYFNGQPFAPGGDGIIAVNALTMAGQYIGISCWTFNVTPELDLNVDGHPNNAWLNGALDDVRIYNRALSAPEVAALYHSFNTLPPSIPTNITAVAPSSSQIQLYWSPSTDKYGVAGYVIRRDGVVVSDQTNTYFLDTGLSPATAYNYTVAAYDFVGNYSAESPAVNIATRAVDGGVDFIVDDADGLPFVIDTGNWPRFSTVQFFQGYHRIGSSSDENASKGLLSQRYTPVLPEAGSYTVYMWYPGNSSRTHLVAGTVPVDIIHAGVTNTVIVNQKVNFSQWVSLGSYAFDAGTNGSVLIRNGGTTGLVFGDALRFVK